MDDVLALLEGAPLVGVGRVLNMGVFEFGSLVEVERTGAEPELAGELALHVQCPFRMTDKSRIILGSAAVGIPASSERIPDGLVRRDGEYTLYDIIGFKLNSKLQSDPVHVRSFRIGSFGSLSIHLEKGVAIEAFPDGGGRDEQWRFLHRYGEHHVYPSE